MEAHLLRGCGDVTAAHVKTEDENTPALEESRQDAPAGGGGGESRQGAPAGGGGGGESRQDAPAGGGESRQAAPAGGGESRQAAPAGGGGGGESRQAAPAGGGGGGGELQAASSSSLLLSASVMPAVSSAKPLPPAKPLPCGWDFSSAAVQSLIGCVGRRWALYEARERSRLFSSVQEEMAAEGHVLPVEKIRRKWNNLIVTYKRVKERGRQGGGAKTSWEFFHLMDATLCDTIGSQVVSNKRTRGVSSVSSPPFTNVSVKPAQLSPLPTAVPPDGDFAPPTPLSPPPPPEMKPLIVLNGDIMASGLHPANIVPAPPLFVSSPPSTASTDLNALVYRRAPPPPTASAGVVPPRLGPSPSSFCLTSSAAPAVSQSGEAALREASLRREEEQNHLVGVARRRGEARERRRERREVKMSAALSRMATALELISSKQDTVIALLQRLAERQ